MRIYLAPIHLCQHAVRRMLAQELTLEQVKAALYNPDSQYPLDGCADQVMVKRLRDGAVVKVYFRWETLSLKIRSVWVTRA